MLWRTLQTPSFSKMGLLYNFRPKWSFFFNEFPFPSNSIFSWDFCLKWLIIWVVFWSQDLLVCLLLRLQTVLEAFRTSCFFLFPVKLCLWGEDGGRIPFYNIDLIRFLFRACNWILRKQRCINRREWSLRLGLLSKWARLVSRSVHSIPNFQEACFSCKLLEFMRDTKFLM